VKYSQLWEKRNERVREEDILIYIHAKVGSIDIFIKQIPEEYRKRWNIETGYRVKKDFKIRTCSKSPVARTLLFCNTMY